MGLLREATKLVAAELLSMTARACDRASQRLQGEPYDVPVFEYVDADDQVRQVVTPEAMRMVVGEAGGDLIAEKPKPLAGSLEARGLRAVR